MLGNAWQCINGTEASNRLPLRFSTSAPASLRSNGCSSTCRICGAREPPLLYALRQRDGHELRELRECYEWARGPREGGGLEEVWKMGRSRGKEEASFVNIS